MSVPVTSLRGDDSDRSRLPSPIEAIECPYLARAAKEVAAGWDRDVEMVQSEREYLVELLVPLCSTINQTRAGNPRVMDARLGSARARVLVDLLRTQLIDGWSRDDPRPETGVVIEILHAVEGVRARIETGGELSSFSNALHGADGLHLVVEVAHDLRSPLTSILFLAETLQRGQSGSVTDLQQRQLGLIYSAALGLSTMASNVLEIARGGTRLSDEGTTPFSICDAFESVRDIVQPMVEEKGLSIRLNPPASDRRLGAPQALGRVLLNLTTNAIKFTEEGSVELVGKATSLTRIEFSIRDTGHGIPPSALETLYHPFRRVSHDDRFAFSSTGLGLALCRRLIAAMGSELHVETRPGWGTRFFFELELPPARRL